MNEEKCRVWRERKKTYKKPTYRYDGSENAICACAHTFRMKIMSNSALTIDTRRKRMRVKRREEHARQGRIIYAFANVWRERKKIAPQIICNEMKPSKQHLGNENNSNHNWEILVSQKLPKTISALKEKRSTEARHTTQRDKTRSIFSFFYRFHVLHYSRLTYFKRLLTSKTIVAHITAATITQH